MRTRSLLGAASAALIFTAVAPPAQAAPYDIRFTNADCMVAADGSATALQKATLTVSNVDKFLVLKNKGIRVGPRTKFFLRPTTTLAVEATQGGPLDMVTYRKVQLPDTKPFKKRDLTWTYSAAFDEPIVPEYSSQFFRYDIAWTLYFDGSKKDIKLVTFQSSSGVFNCEDIGF